MLNVSIRRATASDARVIAAIHTETIRVREATMELDDRSEADVLAWLTKLGPREELYVAEVAGEVVGWGVIKRYSPRPGYDRAGETSVYLRRTWRRRGVGTQLKVFLRDRCRALSYHHLVARILADNEASIAYNRALGYTEVGVQKEIGFIDGRWRDVLIMQYLLVPSPDA